MQKDVQAKFVQADLNIASCLLSLLHRLSTIHTNAKVQ